MPKISIIIPAYNVEDYIEECINSILNQTFSDIEVIAVDDGSSDRTGSILDSIVDERLQVFHKKNGGLVSARKWGIRNATGEYITFVDGDDYIATQTYEILYQSAENTNADVIYNQAYFSDHNSDITIVSKQLKTGLYSVEKNNMDYIWHHIWGDYEDRFAQSACFSLYKKAVASAAYMPIPDELILSEDQVFMAILSITAKSIYIMREPFYYYRYRYNSISHMAQPNVLSMIQQKYELVSRYFEHHTHAEILMKQLKYHTIQSLMELKFLSNIPITFYLFPYEKVPANSRIILYGAAEVGQSYYNQIQINHYCTIECWADIRFEELKPLGVVAPDTIPDMQYDYIVIAVLSKNQAISISEHLVEKYNVKKEHIIMHEPKSFVDFLNLEL